MKIFDLKQTKDILLGMNPKKEIEPLILKKFNAKKADINAVGIDGIITTKSNKAVKLEVKCHGNNLAHFGDVDIEKSVEENISNLCKADLYAFVRPQKRHIELMTKAEFMTWVVSRVVLQKSSKNNWKFRIGYNERQKGADRKIAEIMA